MKSLDLLIHKSPGAHRQSSQEVVVATQALQVILRDARRVLVVVLVDVKFENDHHHRRRRRHRRHMLSFVIICDH